MLAFGGCDYIDADGRTIAVSNAGRLATFLLPWGPDLIPHPGTMVRLDALEAIGGFDRSLKYAMDLDAFLKLRAHGRFAWTREIGVGLPLARRLVDRGEPAAVEPRIRVGEASSPAPRASADQRAVDLPDPLGVCRRGVGRERPRSHRRTGAPSKTGIG